MVAHIRTVAFRGMDVLPVEVQVHLTAGLPAIAIVGLPDKAIAESKERVRSALLSMGVSMPAKRVTINLSPANLAKEGSHYDLPIALGMLAAMEVIPADACEHMVCMGELALDGRLREVTGILPAALQAASEGYGFICPAANGSEARWAGELQVLAPNSLMDFIQHVKGIHPLEPPPLKKAPATAAARDLSEVRGQPVARRALEVAAAGRHNLLMIGPPGAGKSLLASCLPGILPPMRSHEMLEASMVASIAGTLDEGRLISERPYRDPHHSSSMPAMIGGGRRALPGEISLAHHGVLFLDELPEFPRAVLESLRQPLETRTVSIARAEAHVTYPANIQLIAAMNPCRCGYLGEASRECGRAPNCAVDYQSKLSGPLLDRIDMHVAVPAVDTLAVMDMPAGEPSAAVRERVIAARERQEARYAEMEKVHFNAELSGEALMELAMPSGEAQTMLRNAADRMKLSMRGLHRIMRVARTIADLDGADAVQTPHVAEALSYRQPVFQGMSAAA